MHATMHIALAVVTAAMAGANVLAQNRGVPVPAEPATSGLPTDAITLTGCLVREPTSTTFTAGDESGFVLTDVAAGNRMGPSGPSNSDAPSATPPGPDDQTLPPGGGRAVGEAQNYRLRAAEGVDLAAHIDQQVIVSGTMPSAAAREGATRPGSGDSTVEESASVSGAVLHVTSVTMVSESCQKP